MSLPSILSNEKINIKSNQVFEIIELILLFI